MNVVREIFREYSSLVENLTFILCIAAETEQQRRVQNAAAQLVLNLDRRAHISPTLQKLHWLPVMHRVTFKIATLMHQILQKRYPSYLDDLITVNTTYSQRRHLRSSTTRSAAVRRAQTQFGKRAFSVCGLIV